MESYLREDVPCGSPACTVCKPTLPRLPDAASHLVIPEAAVVGDYLEVFQQPEMQGVVYLTSSIKQVCYTNSSCKGRQTLLPSVTCTVTLQVLAKGNLRKGIKIRELYSDVRRQCVLFDDTHCVWTAGQRSERFDIYATLSKKNFSALLTSHHWHSDCSTCPLAKYSECHIALHRHAAKSCVQAVQPVLLGAKCWGGQLPKTACFVPTLVHAT